MPNETEVLEGNLESGYLKDLIKNQVKEEVQKELEPLKEKLKQHRLIALFVGFFGAIAANLAAFFVRKDEDEKIDKLQRDINSINEKLDKLAKK